MKIRLFFLAVVIAFSGAHATEPPPKYQYIQASIINLRSGPNKNDSITVKLPIATLVSIVSERGKWLRVRDENSGWIGWLQREYVGPDKPTHAKMWENYKKTDPTDFATQQKWLERAYIFDRLNLSGIDTLAEVYLKRGKHKQAKSMQQEAAFIRNPEAFVDKDEPQILFLFNRGRHGANDTIQAFAYLENQKLTKVFEDQKDADLFVQKYFRPGRRFQLFDGGRMIGTTTVDQAPMPGTIIMDGCHGGLSTSVKSTFSNSAIYDGLIVASNKPIPMRPFVKRALTTDEAKIVTGRAVMAAYVNRYYASEIDTVYFKDGFISGLVSAGNNVELKGYVYEMADGSAQLISLARFPEFANHHADGKPLFVVSIAPLMKGKMLGPIEHSVTVDYGKNLRGMIDIDGDGYDDFIFDVSYYEWQQTEIYSYRDGLFDAIYKGAWSGC